MERRTTLKWMACMASSATSTTSLVAGSCLQAAADSQAHAVVACWLWGTAVLPHYAVEMSCWLLRMVDQVVERSGLRTRRSMPIDNGVWRLGIGLGDFACEWLLIWLLMGGQPNPNSAK